MNQTTSGQLYTLTQACELLSISTATGRNWLKSGRWIPSCTSDSAPLFTEAYLMDLKEKLRSGTITSLKGRRNKTYVTGTNAYRSYLPKTSPNQTALQTLLSCLEAASFSLTEHTLLCLLRDCAGKLIAQSGAMHCDPLLDELVPSGDFTAFTKAFPNLKEISYTYFPAEDTLGFLYLSLRCLTDRKSSGSYYTPAWLAKRLIEQHIPTLDNTKSILDPSCGTGIFLLQLPTTLPLTHIFGNDLNPVCVTLARINLAMKYRITTQGELRLLQTNLTVSDFLAHTQKQKDSDDSAPANGYDIILGNPPWGARLSSEEKKRYQTHFSCAAGHSIETFDLFLEESIRQLSSTGVLSFVLPEAVLTVKNHAPVRELLLLHTRVLSVEYLGEAFEQVHCPSIILTLSTKGNEPFFKNVTVYHKSGLFTTKVERELHADSFPFLQSDRDYLLLEKILTCPNHTTLVDHADFALGIVTGNNSALIHTSPAPGLEPVIRGSNISKYHINSYAGYLAFLPEQFQQTAPEAMYRAPEKLFYRFINRQLVFAYDTTGLLSLNSCNILIPRFETLSIKYVLAILNSSVAQYVFEQRFHSVKVLRSHLEQLPIPMADKETQDELVQFVDYLMQQNKTSEEYLHLYTLLDKKIAALFGLTNAEWDYINQ